MDTWMERGRPTPKDLHGHPLTHTHTFSLHLAHKQKYKYSENAPSSDARSPSSFLFLVVRPGAPSSVKIRARHGLEFQCAVCKAIVPGIFSGKVGIARSPSCMYPATLCPIPNSKRSLIAMASNIGNLIAMASTLLAMASNLPL